MDCSLGFVSRVSLVSALFSRLPHFNCGRVYQRADWLLFWLLRLAKEYGLKQLYRKDFDEVYAEEQDNPESASLAEKMGVTTNGEINMDAEQWSACGRSENGLPCLTALTFIPCGTGMYMAFAFIKTGD